MHTMTSELVAARLQPLLAEMRQMREIMATKADLARFATKEDLAERDASIIKWVFRALMAQAAFIVALIKLFP